MMPNDKGQVERFFKTFQDAVCRPVFGNIGEGIRSKDVDARPPTEILKKYLRKNYLRSKSELTQLFTNLIDQYNNKAINSNKSPNVVFEHSSCPYAIRIKDQDIAFLFWECETRKVYRSCVTIQYDGIRYQYPINDPEFKIKINNTRVHAYSNREYKDRIYIFSLDEKFITKLEVNIGYNAAIVERGLKEEKFRRKKTAQNYRVVHHLKKVDKSDRQELKGFERIEHIELLDPSFTPKPMWNEAEKKLLLDKDSLGSKSEIRKTSEKEVSVSKPSNKKMQSKSKRRGRNRKFNIINS